MHLFTYSFFCRLLPVISISFLLVVLLLSVAGRRLGGPPLCYSSCSVCLGKWSASHRLYRGDNSGTVQMIVTQGIDRTGCGYANGKELLSYYTIAQTSYIMFVTVLVSMAGCMAWRVADEEVGERQQAEEWLKRWVSRSLQSYVYTI